jgi:hypothetical protein
MVWYLYGTYRIKERWDRGIKIINGMTQHVTQANITEQTLLSKLVNTLKNMSQAAIFTLCNYIEKLA